MGMRVGAGQLEACAGGQGEDAGVVPDVFWVLKRARAEEVEAKDEPG